LIIAIYICTFTRYIPDISEYEPRLNTEKPSSLKYVRRLVQLVMSQWTEEEREEALRRRMEGPLMAAQLTSATVMKFVSKGVVSADDTGPEKEEFIATESFSGSKAGYVYKVRQFPLDSIYHYYQLHGLCRRNFSRRRRLNGFCIHGCIA
jgi:hypothetical protein